MDLGRKLRTKMLCISLMRKHLHLKLDLSSCGRKRLEMMAEQSSSIPSSHLFDPLQVHFQLCYSVQSYAGFT